MKGDLIYNLFTLILKVMKKLLLVLYILFAATILHAQKVYFIYLQSETSTPFYIKMGDKVISASTEGYLIIPKLRDSRYNFFIGFPGSQNEHKFSVNINKADRGFVIKKFNDGISLFDLQTLTNYKSIQASVNSAPTQTRNDSFTRLLSQAANDTTLLTESLAIKEVEKVSKNPVLAVVESANFVNKDSVLQQLGTSPEPVNQNTEKVLAGGTAAVSNQDSFKAKEAIDTNATIASTLGAIKKGQPDDIQQEFRRSVVLRHAESSISEGFGLVFLDVTDGLIDTIRIVIPNPPISIEAPPQASANSDRKFLELPDTIVSKNEQISPRRSDLPKAAVKCASLASDDDFFKIRRDMASKKIEEDMIAQAKKHFKSRCFKTEHIKYLSVLFLTDAGKYQFFDAAHLHVSDVQKFEALQSEMSDPYYINRFKALVAR